VANPPLGEGITVGRGRGKRSRRLRVRGRFFMRFRGRRVAGAYHSLLITKVVSRPLHESEISCVCFSGGGGEEEEEIGESPATECVPESVTNQLFHAKVIIVLHIHQSLFSYFLVSLSLSRHLLFLSIFPLDVSP